MNMYEILRIIFGGFVGFFVVDILMDPPYFFEGYPSITIFIIFFSVSMIIGLFYLENEYGEKTDRYNLKDD